jgi:hypothetical protein
VSPRTAPSGPVSPRTAPAGTGGASGGHSCRHGSLDEESLAVLTANAKGGAGGAFRPAGEGWVSEAQKMLYNRLCAIFEEDKVRYVMTRHPEEVHPQKICSLILKYFPS